MKTSGLFTILACMTLFLREPSMTQADDTKPVPTIRIGSKSFTESIILGEIAKHLVESTGAKARHRGQLGGTQMLWKALLNGEIDLYPEYTGTITEEIFSKRRLGGAEDIRRALAEHGVLMSRELGFKNNYAIGMKDSLAAEFGLRTISGLRRYPELKFGFSNEFMSRGDGWRKLKWASTCPIRMCADWITAWRIAVCRAGPSR